MNFDVYYPFCNNGAYIPGTKPVPTSWNKIVKEISQHDFVNQTIAKIRSSQDKDEQSSLKKSLPAVTFMGTCEGKRSASNTVPNGLVMVDIDHCKDARGAWETLCEEMGGWKLYNLMLVHITSRMGLRIVFVCQEGMTTIRENHAWFREKFKPERFGDFDEACCDLSRLSFLFGKDDLLYDNTALYLETWPYADRNTIKGSGVESASPARAQLPAPTASELEFTDEEIERFEASEYRGTPLKTIVSKWVEVKGEPGTGEVHNYYNEMVKYFRNIANNDKRLLLYILPRFSHTAEECMSQINSICRVNTLSSLPKPFYFFLKDNGFYKTEDKIPAAGSMRAYMMSEEVVKAERPPYLPPVFKQLVGIAPDDFVEPAISALLPILGTLTSFAKAKYPYDDRYHTTSFFSVIYAPPGTGKGFVERYMDLLFEELRLRDFVQSERENIYLRILNRKGDNDKSPENPRTSLRLIPAKNSEAEFLEKQRDNHGYHMFTYAAEMDSWAKGAKAAGGNKDDMIRIAWDNGEYGQQFKSANTFKGKVNLYWNVLITGTLQQVESYFKNVENGLVTRCGFSSIENQEFALPPKWRKLTSNQIAAVRKFAQYCDSMTYETPCTVSITDLDAVSDDDFDNEIDWHFKFKERVEYDCSWIMPTIEKFHMDQMKLAALDVDKARDVFRRRVGVRGFRLALLCMCLWQSPKKSDLEKCALFIRWWMERDLNSMLKLWGAKYNAQADTTPTLVQRTVFNELGDNFNKSDMYTVCVRQGIKTPLRKILFDWKKLGYIEKIDKENYRKIKKVKL